MNQQLKAISPRGILMMLYLVLSSIAWSRTDITPMASMAIQIAISASSDFEATGEWPPMEKLTGFERSALQTEEPYILDRFNTFSGVPGAPLLKEEEGPNMKYPGFRLYAINRIPNVDHAHTPEQKREGGRFAVLVKEEHGKYAGIQVPWIVESEAQMFLRQIGGFNPAKAPFVFEDTYVKLGGKVEKFYQKNNPERFYENQRSQAESELNNRRLLWIGGVVMLLIPVTWYVIRKKR